MKKYLFFFLLLIAIPGAFAQTNGKGGFGGKMGFGGGPSASGGSLTLGETIQNATDSNQNLPLANLFTTPSGSSGFTVNNVAIYQGDSVSHTIDVGIYSTTGSPPVPSSLLCHASNTTSTVGINTFTITGCPTLSASTVYALAFIDSSANTNQGKVTVPLSGAGVSCPAAPINRAFTVFSTGQGSAVLPSSWGGTTNATSTCWTANVNITCVGACGNVPSNLTLVDFEGLTDSVTVTSVTLAHFQGCGGNVQLTWGLSGSSYSGYTGATAAQNSFVNPQSLCGSMSTGSGSLGLDYATNTPAGGPFSQTIMSFQAPANKASILFPVIWTFTNDASHAYSNFSIGGGETVSMQLTNSVMKLEVTPGGASSGLSVTDGNLAFVCLIYDGVAGHNHTLNAYDNTGTLIGTQTHVNGGTTTVPSTVNLGITGAEAEATGFHLRWDNVLIDPTGTFACTP